MRVEQGFGKRAIKLIERKQELWFIDQIINDRGIDMDLVAKSEAICEAEKAALEKELREVTDPRVGTIGAVQQLEAFVNESGFELEACDKEKLEALLTRDDLAYEVCRGCRDQA